jgi:hypothetical protein
MESLTEAQNWPALQALNDPLKLAQLLLRFAKTNAFNVGRRARRCGLETLNAVRPEDERRR